MTPGLPGIPAADSALWAKLFNQLDLFGRENPVAQLTRYHWNRVEGILDGRALEPVTWEINPAFRCNLACSFCLYPDETGSMPTLHFCELVDQAKDLGAKAIIVAGDGEPTVHKDIAKLLLHAKEVGLDVFLYTNGTMINRTLPAEVAVDTCTMIIWGIYGATRESYKAITRRDMFERACGNMASVVATRNKRQQAGPVLVGGWVATGDNIGEASATANLVAELGLDRAYLRTDVTGESFTNAAQVNEFLDTILSLKSVPPLGIEGFVQGRVLFDRKLQFEIDDRQGQIGLFHQNTPAWPDSLRWYTWNDILYIGPSGEVRVSTRRDLLPDGKSTINLSNAFGTTLRRILDEGPPPERVDSGDQVIGQVGGRKVLTNLVYNLLAGYSPTQRESVRAAILARYPETSVGRAAANHF